MSGVNQCEKGKKGNDCGRWNLVYKPEVDQSRNGLMKKRRSKKRKGKKK
jgi:hypothetical protein